MTKTTPVLFRGMTVRTPLGVGTFEGHARDKRVADFHGGTPDGLVPGRTYVIINVGGSNRWIDVDLVKPQA